MELAKHGRYAYSPIIERPDYSWPDGKRLAFYIGLNVEHFAFGQGGMGHTTTELGPPPDVRNYAWRDYGLRVGIWRLFDMFDELGLPVAHLLNTTVYDYAPQILERIRARGDEIIGHGRTNTERQADYPEAEEAALIREATEAITRHEGTPPRGWMGPWISHSPTTPDLLKEAGYDFLMDWPCDDQPFWMKTRSGPLLSVPYPVEINDSPAHLNRRHTAVEFCEMLTDQFDEMIVECEKQPLVMGLPLHTFIVGQPYRLARLRKALRYIVDHPKAELVWFTRPNAIADHVMGLPKGTVAGSEIL